MDLEARPLIPRDFEPFGQVIELEGAREIPINQGLTTRYHDLFRVQTDRDGFAMGNVFRTTPLPMPHRVTIMERHPLGSQAFIPLGETPFLVLVGKPGDKLMAEDLVLFRTNGRQGVNFHANTWHHFQIVMDHVQDFYVIDRGGPGDNLEETEIDGEVWIRG